MSAMYFLLPVALGLGAVFVGLFVWAVSRGQFDDIDDAPERMLHED